MPSFESIANTCRNRLATEIATPFSYPVLYDNAPEPAHTGLWLRGNVLFGASRLVEFGGTVNNYRTIGVFLVQVRIPLAVGDQIALQAADRIADVFRAVTVSGVTFRAPSVDPFGRDGSWWLVNVQCPFFSDEVA